MKTITEESINPFILSFRQLRSRAAGTAGKLLPSPEELRSGIYKILFSHETNEVTITVFSNGFFLYEHGNDAAVYAVDRCRPLYYKDSDGQARSISEKDYLDGPCLIPLLMTGDSSGERVMEDYEFYWDEFSNRHDL